MKEKTIQARDYDAIAEQADEAFYWMVFQNGGFWIFARDFFTKRPVEWRENCMIVGAKIVDSNGINV